MITILELSLNLEDLENFNCSR